MVRENAPKHSVFQNRPRSSVPPFCRHGHKRGRSAPAGPAPVGYRRSGHARRLRDPAVRSVRRPVDRVPAPVGGAVLRVWAIERRRSALLELRCCDRVCCDPAGSCQGERARLRRSRCTRAAPYVPGVRRPCRGRAAQGDRQAPAVWRVPAALPIRRRLSAVPELSRADGARPATRETPRKVSTKARGNSGDCGG